MSKLADWIIARVTRRPPDFVIGGQEKPYLRRWWLIPRNRFFNVYLHQFLRSDDDRALHDHPWANASILLRGGYIEHTIDAGGIHRKRLLEAVAVRVRLTGKIAHRVELLTQYVRRPAGVQLNERVSEIAHIEPAPCWTIFITGPRYREWGFHCPEQGWIPWQRFVDERDIGSTGKGCDA